MAELKHIKVEQSDGVARITFARPKHNVLDIEMMNELNGQLEDMAEWPQMCGYIWRRAKLVCRC
jgi:cyclohexa-1,5-dienecarbonyl-CoA hydratase